MVTVEFLLVVVLLLVTLVIPVITLIIVFQINRRIKQIQQDLKLAQKSD